MNRLLNVLQTFATPHLIEKLKKTPLVVLLNPETSEVMYIPGATRGNKPYAWAQKKRMDDVREYIEKNARIDGDRSNTGFWTLTVDHKKYSPLESWEVVKEALGDFVRKLKVRFDGEAYITQREAHLSGHCHVHGLMVMKHQMQGFHDRNGKLRNREMRVFIRENWKLGRIVDCELAQDANIASYLTNELGKYAQVENSLRRADKGTETSRDVKVMLTHYYADISRSRLFTTSRNLSIKVDEGFDSALLDVRNNSGVPRVMLVLRYKDLREILDREDCFYTDYRAPPGEFELIMEWLKLKGRQLST